MRRYFFNAMLSAEQCYGYYRGDIKNVVVTTDSGERVQLMFKLFQRFIGSDGIRGRFRLIVSEQGAFVSLDKIN